MLSLTNGGSVELPGSSISLEGLFYYGDKDGDGFGDKFKAVWVPTLESPPAGYIVDMEDCDDNDASINPDAIDIQME